MAKTRTFTVDTNDTAVVAQTWTKSIRVMEDAGVASWPTTDFLVKAPDTSATAIQRPAGTEFTFESPVGYFPAGKTVAYIKTATGSTTFQQYEVGL